jgi:hypothetical protein
MFRILDQKLPGIGNGKRARKTIVVAYADDITIPVTPPTDIRILSDAIQCYVKATGASLTKRKSKVLAVGGQSTSTDTFNVTYHAEIKILGVTFGSTIEHSMNKSPPSVTGKVRAQARGTYEQDFSL